MSSVIEAAHRFGGYSPPPKPLATVSSLERRGLDKLIAAFLKSRNMESTRESYRKDIMGSENRQPGAAMTWLEFLDARGVDFFAATREDVDDWRLYMEGEDLSEATRSRRITAVSGLYAYGVYEWRGFPRLKDGENPAKHVKRPKVGNYLQYLGPGMDELRVLLAAPEKPAYRLLDRNWRRTSAIVSVLAHTGLRRNELVNADVSSISTKRGHHVIHVVRKGGHHQEIVMVPDAVKRVERYLDGRTTGPLILSEEGKRIDGTAVWRSMRRLGIAAMPDRLAELHPHDLRHACATLLYEQGAQDWEVQTILGHADARTSQRYNHAKRALEESPLHRLGAALAGTDSVHL